MTDHIGTDTGRPELRRCPVCHGRGYFHCECWPGDCICGLDYEDCEECRGTGWIDPTYDDLDDGGRRDD